MESLSKEGRVKAMKLPVSLVLLTACAYHPAAAAAPQARSVQSPSVKTAANSRRTTSTDREGQSRTTSMACYLKIDGVVRVNNRCSVFLTGDGGYTLNSWDRGKPGNSHFAVVSVTPDGVGDATWNADPNDDRAMDPLGCVTMNHGCWRNVRVRICARDVQRRN